MTLLQVIQLGRKYLHLWPKQPELINYFTEYRQVIMSRFLCRYVLPLALLMVLLPFVFSQPAMLQQSIISALFILSMPVQAYIMLGLQADKFLPPSLANWYRQGVAKVNEQGGSIKLSVNQPKYFDLVTLLNITYQRQT